MPSTPMSMNSFIWSGWSTVQGMILAPKAWTAATNEQALHDAVVESVYMVVCRCGPGGDHFQEAPVLSRMECFCLDEHLQRRSEKVESL